MAVVKKQDVLAKFQEAAFEAGKRLSGSVKLELTMEELVYIQLAVSGSSTPDEVFRPGARQP